MQDFLAVCKTACNTDWNLQNCKKICSDLQQSQNLEASCHQIGVCPSQFPPIPKPQPEATPVANPTQTLQEQDTVETPKDLLIHAVEESK